MRERPKAGSIGWIDLTVDDAEGVRDFYKAVAGWGHGEVSMGDYADYVMQPREGGPVAGICHARGANEGLPPQWMIYIVVDDLETSLATCRERGGELVAGPKGEAGADRYAVIRDPGGAVAALFQPAD
jgi:predicted enzyme related to lactoylglutathione lyase